MFFWMWLVTFATMIMTRLYKLCIEASFRLSREKYGSLRWDTTVTSRALDTSSVEHYITSSPSAQAFTNLICKIRSSYPRCISEVGSASIKLHFSHSSTTLVSNPKIQRKRNATQQLRKFINHIFLEVIYALPRFTEFSLLRCWALLPLQL